MIPDPGTFTLLPWAPKTALVFCDLYMTNGQPFPLAPRTILKNTLAELAGHNYQLVTGLEMEWYLTRIVDTGLGTAPWEPRAPPPTRPRSHRSPAGTTTCSPNTSTRSTTSSARSAPRSPRWGCRCAPSTTNGRPARWKPPSTSSTAWPRPMPPPCSAPPPSRSPSATGTSPRSCAPPAIEGFYASGWHLHTSIADLDTGHNLMVPPTDDAPLSQLGRHYVGGAPSTTPSPPRCSPPPRSTATAAGARTHSPPDRLTWGGQDNRAAMMRVISAPERPRLARGEPGR